MQPVVFGEGPSVHHGVCLCEGPSQALQSCSNEDFCSHGKLCTNAFCFACFAFTVCFLQNQPDQPEIAWACEVYVAVTGKPFCSAARSSFVFFAKYPVQTALDKMASTVPGFARLEKLPEKIDMPKCQSNPKHVFPSCCTYFILFLIWVEVSVHQIIPVVPHKAVAEVLKIGNP